MYVRTVVEGGSQVQLTSVTRLWIYVTMERQKMIWKTTNALTMNAKAAKYSAPAAAEYHHRRAAAGWWPGV